MNTKAIIKGAGVVVGVVGAAVDAINTAAEVSSSFAEKHPRIVKFGGKMAETLGRGLINAWVKKMAKDKPKSNSKDDQTDQEKKRTKPSHGSSLSDICDRAGQMPDPIIPGALFPGDMCTLAGENHSGKSLLMYHIGIRLAEGKPLNLSEKRLFPPSRYHVIMYDRENNDMTLSKRYGNLSIKNLKVIRGFEFKTIDELLDDLELQLNSIDKGQNVLACIDNATAFKMPVSGSKITDFYTRLQSIIDKEEVFNKHLTVIIAAHLSSSSTSKNDDARVLGATQLISGASANLYIKNTRFGKHKKILKATKNRLEDWPEQVFLLNVIDTAPWHFEFEKMMDEKDALPETGSRSKGPIPSSSSQKEAILDQEPTTEPKAATDKETIIITLARKGKTKIEIHRETGISRPTINKYWPDDLPTKPGDQSK